MMYATRSRLVTAVTVALCGSAAFVVSPNVAWASSYSVQGNSGGFFFIDSHNEGWNDWHDWSAFSDAVNTKLQ